MTNAFFSWDSSPSKLRVYNGRPSSPSTHLEQPVEVVVDGARVGFVDFDNREEVLVGHQDLVLVVQQAGQEYTSLTQQTGSHATIYLHLWNFLVNYKYCLYFWNGCANFTMNRNQKLVYCLACPLWYFDVLTEVSNVFLILSNSYKNMLISNILWPQLQVYY